MSGKKPAEEHGESVPIWIISFADMITLLLSFFVMLQTMSHARSDVLFQAGAGSFRRAMSGMGIADLLYGKSVPSGRDYRKIKYPTDEDSSTEQPFSARVINPDDEEVRQVFDGLCRAMQMQASDTHDQVLGVRPLPIHFAPGSDALDGPSQKLLTDFAVDLQQNLTGQSIKIYVIGVAEQSPAGKGPMLLSARRAAAVETFLRASLCDLAAETGWEVQSLGADPAWQWCRDLGIKLQRESIVITILGGTH